MEIQVIQCGKKFAAVAAVISVLLFGKSVKAAETTTLRVISTTDIHSQVSSENYDVAGKDTNKSLARLNTMIKGAKAEMTEGGSITVDVGDSVYGYGAETIMGDMIQPNNNLQPIFAAMGKVGYDALVLGNHEFDYGYTFIKNQIEKAGLTDACVVSNIKDLGTGKYPWQRTKIITKELKTSKGNTVPVKIGVIGIARQNISTYYDYNGILLGESALKTVRTQSAALKKQGADIVVVLAHVAMGEADADDSAADVGYAISQIDDVDCVMLGHQHRNYPSDDANAKMFYSLPNTDKSTGLTNGKPVVMVADHAAGIGVADMILKIDDNNKVSVVSSKAEVRKSSVLVMEDPEIAGITEEYDSVIKETYNEILASVKEGSAITGYFGTLEDNYAIQLNNEAKIRFGMSYIHSGAGADYSSCHVIAATKFYMDGSEGRDDFIEVGSNFTMKDVLNTQEYQHNNNYVYYITGGQLKEWMEWSASIFAQRDEKITSDAALANLMEENGAASVISNQWLNNWRSYTIFDGLEYEIDASLPARYNAAGEIIHEDARRISRLTYNGQEVTDDTTFIIVDNNITSTRAVINALSKQRLTSKAFRTADYLKEYVSELGSFGEIKNEADNNWSVSFGNTLSHIIRSSSLSELYAALKPWYRKTLKVTEEYAYYQADLSNGTKTEDTSGPLLVLCPSTEKETDQDVKIYIQASDSSGISGIYYLEGQHQEEDEEWNGAQQVEDNQVRVSENGVYSVCAVDGNGNRTVKNIRIKNINPAVLQVPTINSFTNKKTEITGEAQPGLAVHITIADQTYNTTATEAGTYSCDVGKQNAGETVSVYVSDSEGKVSGKVSTTVLRRGPNSPTLNTVTNKTITLSGKINDTNSTVLAYIGKKVYVPKSKGAAIYKNCGKYNKNKTITNALSYSVKEGIYYIKVPVPVAQKKITIFAVDEAGKCSLTEEQIAKEEAPNQPQVNEICEVERYVAGKIPEATKVCKITVKADGQTFVAKSEKNGDFMVNTKGFAAGTVVKVSASDSQNGKTRTSVVAETTVGAKSKYVVSADKSTITVKGVNNYSTTVQGKVKGAGAVFVNFGETSAKVELNGDGTFSYTLPSPLEGGTALYITHYNKTNGELEEVKQVNVKTKKPVKPEILEKKISKKAQKITVLAKEKATVVVKAGEEKIKVTDCRYNTKRKMFVYSVEIPKGKGKITCFIRNAAGTSKKISVVRQ